MSNVDDYKGWKLFDKVTIVSRPITKWNYETHENIATGECQGFLVDPKNKKQLESALSWGTSYEYEYFTDEKGQRSVKERREVKPEQYTYDNKDFILELSEAAEQSSQGGKLSFWNCWITAPDGKKFLVGIAANLLLDLLKSTTVVNGKVQAPLMFARCKGGVGMLSADTQSYKDAINDAAIKKNTAKGKTSKHKVGYVYETLTQKDVYFGDVYQWYDPIYEETDSDYWPYRQVNKLVGFRKLTEPKKLKWFTTYHAGSDPDFYHRNFGGYQLEEKLPARKEGMLLDELPTVAHAVNHLEVKYQGYYSDWSKSENGRMYHYTYIDARDIGLSANDAEYNLPQALRSYILALGYRIED